VRLQDTVANVNYVNVLFHDDVTGKSAVIHPITDALFCGGGVRPGWPVEVSGQIVSFATDNFAERSFVNAPDHFNKGRTIADLEAYIKAQLPFGTLADFDHLESAGYVHGYGFFEINVL